MSNSTEKTNQNIAKEAEDLLEAMDKHLDRLGVIELKIILPICLLAWPLLWFGAGFSWWTALLIALGVMVSFFIFIIRYADRYVEAAGRKILSKRAFGSDENLKFLESLCAARDCQLKEELLFAASGLEKQDYAPGLALLKKMAREIKRGKTAPQAIMSAGEVLKRMDEFIGQEFLDNCSAFLNGKKTAPAHEMLASAAKFHQIKLILESQEPGSGGKDFPAKVSVLNVLFGFSAKAALLENSLADRPVTSI